jgi:hypothetical protein
MDETAPFTTAGQRCFYRPRGTSTAGQLAQMIASSLSFGRDLSCKDALVDITGMYGFDSPGPSFRRWAVTLWSDTIENKLRIAFVARREHICPKKTGLLVAAELGLQANVFETEIDALAWLDNVQQSRERL